VRSMGRMGRIAMRRKVRKISKNIKSPPELSLEQGLNGGWEFAKLSFPRWHLAPHFWGCQLPDAILHGKRSHRPRSRAAQYSVFQNH
jgi:hypothetical protein